ncbi:MAG: hypothetical protein R3C10_19925 [Pirellulales bacterium]
MLEVLPRPDRRTRPQYQPQISTVPDTYLGGPTGTDYTYPDGEMYSGGEQSYEVTYPPSNGYETYMEGPSFEVDPTSQYSPGYEYSPSYPSYEYGGRLGRLAKLFRRR